VLQNAQTASDTANQNLSDAQAKLSTAQDTLNQVTKAKTAADQVLATARQKALDTVITTGDTHSTGDQPGTTTPAQVAAPEANAGATTVTTTTADETSPETATTVEKSAKQATTTSTPTVAKATNASSETNHPATLTTSRSGNHPGAAVLTFMNNQGQVALGAVTAVIPAATHAFTQVTGESVAQAATTNTTSSPKATENTAAQNTTKSAKQSKSDSTSPTTQQAGAADETSIADKKTDTQPFYLWGAAIVAAGAFAWFFGKRRRRNDED